MIANPRAYFTLPDGRRTRAAFIEGPGGVGKTFLYRALHHFARSIGLRGHNTAFTGIAATLLPSGRTFHNLFDLPVPLYSDSNSSIEQGTKAARELLESIYILCDEAPTLPRFGMEAADRKLKDLKDGSLDFGGHFMIFGESD